jgi:hypothetical protein
MRLSTVLLSLALGVSGLVAGAGPAAANYWVEDPCLCHPQQQQVVEEEVYQPPRPVYRPAHYQRPVYQHLVYRPQPKLLLVKYEAPVAREGCSIKVRVDTEGPSTIFIKSSVYKLGRSKGLVVTQSATIFFPVPCELAYASDGAVCINDSYSRVFESELFMLMQRNLANRTLVLNTGEDPPLSLHHP